MNLPIAEFVRGYRKELYTRLHMPGHKGKGFMGEEYDITEIEGADQLYAPTGIIAESEANAAQLFGSRRTCYSTEGSSQCVKAMLFLAVGLRPAGTAPVVLAGRNAHKSLLQAAALVDFGIEWLWDEGEHTSLCTCRITPEGLENALSAMETPPCAVFVTSPDYLGNMLDIRALADVAHRHGTLLLVDNAHGAYLKMLEPSRHPMDLGADLCCDSAHKTLPVLTGGAYLHIGKGAPEGIEARAKEAMALFGSTSPSYVVLTSLDMANDHMSAHFKRMNRRLNSVIRALDESRKNLRALGWELVGDEPLKLTVYAPSCGWDGRELAQSIIEQHVMPEYADPDHLVLMCSEDNMLPRLESLDWFFRKTGAPKERRVLPQARGERVMSVRQAVFAPQETVEAEACLGRVCGAPGASCPPAVPIAMPGEVITPEAVELMHYYGVKTAEVVKE